MKKIELTITFSIFISVLFMSIGYASLNTELTISGEAIVSINKSIKITNINIKEQLNDAYETYNSSFSSDSCELHINLPNLNSSTTYTLSITNSTTNTYYLGEIEELIFTNDNIYYEILNKDNIVFTPNSDVKIDIKLSYKDILPENKELSLNLKFNFIENYKEEILNGATPILNDGFIPVTIANNGTVYVADTQEEWYRYETKTWANAVLVIDQTINYNIGEEIPMNEIKQMYVWIPRYSYDPNSIENENNAIDITFVNNTTPAHPAFTFGEDELKGFWVGKFETGVEFGEDMTATETHFSIKPNIYSIGPMDIYTMYNNVIKTNNNYGLNSNSDLHVIKNTEWGAVNYLTHSIYGICTTSTNCTPMVNNYFQNEQNQIITGCGGTTRPTTTSGIYNVEICPVDYRWNTINGYKASTTNNISGIYDLSAGKYEYVMSFMKNTTGGVHTASSKFTQSNLPNSKYYDLYEENTDNTNSSLAITGDSILEIKDSTLKYTWNSDYAIFHTTSTPFIVRSGRVGSWHYAGMYAYYGVTGSSSGGVGAFATRNIISPI